MQSDVCPHCGNPTDGKCQNPECPSADATTTFLGLKIPTHGWGKALVLAVIFALVSAFVLTIMPIKPKEDENAGVVTGIEADLRHAASPEYEKPITLREGSVEAPAAPSPELESPGGLDWEILKYPGAERKPDLYGTLAEDERLYVTTAPIDDVEQYYAKLIENYFYKAPQSSKVVNGDTTKLSMWNDTGSLVVSLTKNSWDEKTQILISKLGNLADGRLKPFGGPPPEEEKDGEQ